MAQAASYYYSDQSTSCILCRKPTRREKTVRHNVTDLSEPLMDIPCHYSCYYLRVIGFWLQFILIAALVFTTLRFLELGFLYHVYWKWGRLPLFWTVINTIPALFSGAFVATRAYDRFRDKINGYIQLHTFPLD